MVFDGDPKAPSPLIPAATVLLLRDGSDGLEVLLLRRNKALKAFGGAWVFPGGRVDDADGPGLNVIERAKIAAIRETREETGLNIGGRELAILSNWIPPIEEKRRFSTWFFVAQAPDIDVKIDEGEIHDYQWISPSKAIRKVPSPDLMMFPPIYISLNSMAEYETAESAISDIQSRSNEIFETRFTKGEKGFVTCWPGDCGYEDLDMNKDGPRRRLYANPDGWIYQSDFPP